MLLLLMGAIDVPDVREERVPPAKDVGGGEEVKEEGVGVGGTGALVGSSTDVNAG
jgi:hypothetical protein